MLLPCKTPSCMHECRSNIMSMNPDSMSQVDTSHFQGLSGKSPWSCKTPSCMRECRRAVVSLSLVVLSHADICKTPSYKKKCRSPQVDTSFLQDSSGNSPLSCKTPSCMRRCRKDLSQANSCKTPSCKKKCRRAVMLLGPSDQLTPPAPCVRHFCILRVACTPCSVVTCSSLKCFLTFLAQMPPQVISGFALPFPYHTKQPGGMHEKCFDSEMFLVAQKLSQDVSWNRSALSAIILSNPVSCMLRCLHMTLHGRLRMLATLLASNQAKRAANSHL